MSKTVFPKAESIIKALYPDEKQILESSGQRIEKFGDDENTLRCPRLPWRRPSIAFRRLPFLKTTCHGRDVICIALKAGAHASTRISSSVSTNVLVR